LAPSETAAPAGVAILEVRDLRARYGEIEAVKGVDLTVPRGAIVALLGANGAGKTSTLRAITGTIRTTGTVAFDGKTLAHRSPEDAAQLGIAHVPEGRGTLGSLTVWENLMLGAYLERSGAQVRKRCEYVAAYFPWISERRQQPAGTLSGGEQQMLAIGRALMARPKLLLLDEPSLGLAPLVVRKIFQIIREINAAGTTIFLVEQNAHMALAIANRGYVLQSGEVLLTDTAKNLLNHPDVKKAYLGG
jgi:branched-chain amino acid transport system ATP-binding protein